MRAVLGTGIALGKKDTDRALGCVKEGLNRYQEIQSRFRAPGAASDREFRRLFNRFYRVRRDSAWQDVFYGLLERQKSRRAAFGDVLRELHRANGRVEASFASKLVATVDPSQPVIDSIVLRNVGLSLRTWDPLERRFEHAIGVHARLAELFGQYLAAPSGHYLVAEFERRYPHSTISKVKMLDLVLWQARF